MHTCEICMMMRGCCLFYHQMVLVETVVTGFADEFPVLSKNGCLRLLTTIGVAIFFFFCGLGMTAQVLTTQKIFVKTGID